MNKVDIVGQIADLKEIDYKNTLAIASIIEVLIDKGIIDRNDIAKKAYELENMTTKELKEKSNNEKWKNEKVSI